MSSADLNRLCTAEMHFPIWQSRFGKNLANFSLLNFDIECYTWIYLLLGLFDAINVNETLLPDCCIQHFSWPVQGASRTSRFWPYIV